MTFAQRWRPKITLPSGDFLSELTQVRRQLEPGNLKISVFRQSRRIARRHQPLFRHASIAIHQVLLSHGAHPCFLVLRIFAHKLATKCDRTHQLESGGPATVAVA
jgi:hypothetical protein